MSNIYDDKTIKDLDDSNLLIVFDTNVLLDLYLLPKEPLTHIINQLAKKSNMLCITNQVYKEFMSNHNSNIERQLSLCKNINQKLSGDINQIKNYINSVLSNEAKYKSHKFKNFKETVTTGLDNTLKQIKEQLEEIDVDMNKENGCISEEQDIIKAFVESIRKDSVFTQMQLVDIFEEGEKRFKYNIPPGFTDANKDKNSKSNKDKSAPKETLVMQNVKKYGDLILWKEILHEAKQYICNVVFVQNEKKEDWWELDQRKKRKIATVLQEEFKEVTEGNTELYMMSFNEFLNHFSEYLGINGKSVDNIRRIIEIRNKVEKFLDSAINGNVNDLCSIYGIDGLLKQTIERYLIGEITPDGSIGDPEIEDISNIVLEEPKVESESNEEYWAYSIEGSLKCDFNGTAQECYSREYRENIFINGEFYTEFILRFNINLNNEHITADSAINRILELISFELEKTAVESIEIESAMFDDEEEYEENYGETKGYTTCPDCGKAISIKTDGGNGFCTNCAAGH